MVINHVHVSFIVESLFISLMLLFINLSHC